MRQELFKEIDKIQVKEKHNDESEIDKIYKLVLDKKRCEKRNNIKKRIKFFWVPVAVVAIVCICVYSFDRVNISDKNEKVASRTSNTDIVIEQNHRIVVSVYESNDKTKTVTANYANEMTKKEIRKGEKVNIGKYSLLSSAVPGYPIMVYDEDKSSRTIDKNVKIKVDNGKLISWNSDTGEVIEKGKKGCFKYGEKIYWTPLEKDKFSKNAKINITLYEDNVKVAKTVLNIYEKQEATYVVEKE